MGVYLWTDIKRKTMKRLISIAGLTAITSLATAQGYLYNFPDNNQYQFKDYWRNSYKNYENLWQDRDNDGYQNYWDRHDQNPNINISPEPTYDYPSYYENYKNSYYDLNRDRTIYEGPRGGQYYINRNGNKTYIK